ncbi:hypothetical protein LLG95_06425 [bacterium]|nr:hypothetical protein [bacterium]
MGFVIVAIQAFLIGFAYWALLGKYIPARRPSYVRCVIGAALLGVWSYAVMYLFVGLQYASRQPLAAGNPIIGLFVGNLTVALYILAVWLIGAYYFMRNVFEMHRGHGALLIIYLVISGVIQVIWSAVAHYLK